MSSLAVNMAHMGHMARLQHLPRETRDTLFLLAVMAGTMAPHVLNVPAWCSAMAAAVLAWRAWLAVAGRALPNRWVVTGLLLLAGALTFSGERTMLGKEAGVTMLVVLMSLKTLELRARRDALVVFFLGFFLVLTQFLYSQALWVGLWMLPALWGLLTALVLAHMPVGRPSIRRAGAAAARATLLGVPLMALLFVLFPRIGPLWGLPQDAVGRTGLSGSLRLGGVASVAEDDSIALRVRFQGPAPQPDQLYFRGPVLSQYDGREWTRLLPTVPVAERARADFRLLGAPLRYEMILEPSRLPLLPMLEVTPDRPDAAPVVGNLLVTMRPDAQWQTERPIDQRVQLQAAAWLQHRHGPFQPVPGLRDHLRLPPDLHPRTRAWAEALRARPELAGADASALAAAVMQHIAEGGFAYTLEPGTYEGDSIDEFWFDRKAGFCEHFASAFVVVMRAMGVPARLITGYQGADPELQDGWMVVRQRNAHAWAEFWQAERGWLRADPTAAVAPTRVQAGRSLRPPPGLMEGALGTIDPALAERLRAAWETMNNRWNQWVLNYSRSQQFDLLRSLGLRHPDWNTLAQLLVGLLCTLALAGAAWAWWDRRRQDPWQRLQARVRERLASLGVRVEPHEAPLARAARVRAQLGAPGEPLAAKLEQLAAARYAKAGALAQGSGQRRPAGRGWGMWWRPWGRVWWRVWWREFASVRVA